MSDPLFTNKAERLVHELKEVKTVHKIVQIEIAGFKDQIKRLSKTEKRDSAKIKRLEAKMDRYILKMVKPKRKKETV